ncbi:MAG: LptF/LptG family permease [Chitinophagaceae bacterium]|nr:LptF/LptG family permease [Chitinophagaceae bacterium]MCF8421604.1 LptF/LptG family permease [Chitinophagaceae bacterium]
MFKKLDILILRAFIGPFLAALTISIFVLTMQFFWLYIDDLVGKGLDTFIILKLVGLVSISMLTTAIPLALLFSSIMTFGNLGESFELIAIKSAGIPLIRFMRPLFIFAIGLAGIAFLLANNIIPVSQMRLTTLKYEIIVSKPAIDLKEGIFYDKIDGYVIKLGKKESNDSVINDIVIFEKRFGLQDNMIMAKSGVMRVTPDKKFLEFILYNGWRYQEKGYRATTNTEFTRLNFKEYKKVFDLKSFQMNKTADVFYDPKMLSVRQLGKAIDSIQSMDSFFIKKATIEIYPYLKFMLLKDSIQLYKKVKIADQKKFKDLIPAEEKVSVVESAGYQFQSLQNNLASLVTIYKEQQHAETMHAIEWHRKFTLSFACIVLFLIGAPLGAIIRKGGLGAPMVSAIAFFVVFFLLNNFGEKLAKSGQWSVYAGMWLSSLFLIPVGLFLTYKAMRDSQLFNQEFYYRFLQPIKVTLQKYFKR